MSLPRRIATIIALLGGLTAVGLISLLWITEPSLPPHTEVAFAALILIGLAWAVFGAWALTRRTPLFALDRVIAAWLAVAAANFLAVIALVVTIVRHQVEPAIYVVAAALSALALINLGRARAHRATLLRRKHELGG
jgi:hypothetical protein